MITLETENAKAQFLLKGAELCSLYNKINDTEYMWSGDPLFWNKFSPILFPIVGTLQSDRYLHQDKHYTLSRHGFARDMDFTVVVQTVDQVTFLLDATADTLSVYPFRFKLYIQYALVGTVLTTTYIVENVEATPMFFSIGAHPAFKVPLAPHLDFTDYQLSFNIEDEKTKLPIPIYPLNNQGLLTDNETPFLQSTTQSIHLDKSLFSKDALIFKSFDAATIRIHSSKDEKALKFTYSGFPYLGIWSKYGADFVCIEPWNGITDHESATGILSEKEGIIHLLPQQVWEGKWQVEII